MADKKGGKKAGKGNWDRLFEAATAQVLDFFEKPAEQAVNLPKVKVATSVLSSYTRHEQTESAREQNAIIIARSLADNKEEFKAYLQISLPKVKLLAASSG